MFEQTFKNIDDILHKDAGCSSELDYTEQSSWLLFLKYLDALEADHEFLLKGDVFTRDLLETWMEFKREKELDPVLAQVVSRYRSLLGAPPPKH